MAQQNAINEHPLFDLVNRFCTLFENGGNDGLNALQDSKYTIEACTYMQSSSPERSSEIDNYMESMLYFSMNRTVELLLEVKEFDENIKNSLIDFQSRVNVEMASPSEVEDVERNRKECHSPESRSILNDWFITNSHHPYPNKDDIDVLSEKTSMSVEQVRHWFNNARKRRIA